MPTSHATLSEQEIKRACLYWIENNCPAPKGKVQVYFNVDIPSNPTPTDQGNGITATVTLGQQ